MARKVITRTPDRRDEVAHKVASGEEHLNSIDVTAEKLDVSTWTVRDLIRLGLLDHVRVGRLIKVPDSTIAAYVRKNMAVGS